MTNLEFITHLNNVVEDPDGDHEAGYIGQWPGIRDRVEESPEAEDQDKRFIRSGKIYAHDGCLSEEYRNIRDEDPWYWHIAKIVDGEYPIGKLPEHVREEARGLYY